MLRSNMLLHLKSIIKLNLDFTQVIFIEFGLIFFINKILQQTNFTALSCRIKFEFSHGASLFCDIVLVRNTLFKEFCESV